MSDPPEAAIEDLQNGRTLLVRAKSACRILPRDPAQRRTSRVLDMLTGKRGILVWIRRPVRLPDGMYSVEFGYHQHELSGGNWQCTIRRRASAWEIASCELLGLS